MKKTLYGIIGTFVFYGLMIGLTDFTSAHKPDQMPITSPITPPNISVGRSTGDVKLNLDDKKIKLEFNAHGGNKLNGKVNYSDSKGKRFKGDVDVCYLQDGKEASFVGTIKKGNVDEDYFLIKVQDNGQGKKANKDRLGIWITDTKPTCALGEYPAEVVKGNLKVHGFRD